MRLSPVPTLAILLVSLAGTSRSQEQGKRAANDGAELVLRSRELDFDRFLEALPRFGVRGGFFPRIFSDEICAGVVIGIARRYPGRLAELMPSKVELQDPFRSAYCGALILGGGERALALLRAEPEKGEELEKLLDFVAKHPDAPRSPVALDPGIQSQAQILFGVLLVRSDAACALRLATALAPVAEEADEEARAATSKARERAVDILRAVCAADAELRETFRGLRPLATPAVQEGIDRILAESAGEER